LTGSRCSRSASAIPTSTLLVINVAVGVVTVRKASPIVTGEEEMVDRGQRELPAR